MARVQLLLCFTFVFASVTFMELVSGHLKIESSPPQIEDPQMVKDVEPYTVKVVMVFVDNLEKKCPKNNKFETFFERLRAYAKYVCPLGKKEKEYDSDMKAKAGSLLQSISSFAIGKIQDEIKEEKQEAIQTFKLMKSVAGKILGGKKKEETEETKLTAEQQKEIREGIMKWEAVITKITNTMVKSEGEDSKSGKESPKGDDSGSKSEDEDSKSGKESPKGDDSGSKSEDEDSKGGKESSKGDDNDSESEDEDSKNGKESPKGEDSDSKSEDEDSKSGKESPKGDDSNNKSEGEDSKGGASFKDSTGPGSNSGSPSGSPTSSPSGSPTSSPSASVTSSGSSLSKSTLSSNSSASTNSSSSSSSTTNSSSSNQSGATTVAELEAETSKDVMAFIMNLEKKCPPKEEYKSFFEKLKSTMVASAKVTLEKKKSFISSAAGKISDAISFIGSRLSGKSEEVKKSMENYHEEVAKALQELETIHSKIITENQGKSDGSVTVTAEQRTEIKQTITKWETVTTQFVETSIQTEASSNTTVGIDKVKLT